ncbi:GL20236 [Drosophila persimilis]|uniref:GL20236 n=1 Tax=Drosophila persimilis TaxID=7234 RepID=B4GXN9_DROPE|nr:larval cuticle protein 16/17 [Drosophila persimilis]EDW27516.1 GL20236 [Drosophila persimilis]
MANTSTVNLLLSVSVAVLLLQCLSLSAAASADPQSHMERQADHRGVRLLDRFDNRYPDGSYEYRFELDDGTARYERGYFALIDKVKTLMVVGYYSYRMTDGRYITVFYNADQFGYRQNQSITPQVYPNLPRSIEVPMASSGTPGLRSQSRSESAYSSPAPSPSPYPTTRSPSESTTTPRGAATSRRGGRF